MMFAEVEGVDVAALQRGKLRALQIAQEFHEFGRISALFGERGVHEVDVADELDIGVGEAPRGRLVQNPMIALHGDTDGLPAEPPAESVAGPRPWRSAGEDGGVRG